MSDVSRLSLGWKVTTQTVNNDPWLRKFESAEGQAVDLLRKNLKEFGLNNSQFFKWAHRSSAHHPVALATLVDRGQFTEVLEELREQQASGELAEWLKKHPR